MSSEIVQSDKSHASGNNGGFSIETVELGLRLTVLSGGDCGRASKLMGDEGSPVDTRTLKKWKESLYRSRYEQLVSEIRAELDDETKDLSKVLAVQAQVVEQDMLAELGKKVKEVEPKDLARSVQAIAQAANVHVGISRLMEEKPVSIVEHRAPSEIIAELKEMGVIDSTGEEVPPDAS